jgi:sporulation protein YlmC with PRC-barrel domain
MKQKFKSIVGLSAVSVLAFAALAQNPTYSKSERSDYQQQRLAQPRADRLNGAAKASDLIGMTVKNYQDEKIGKVEDLAVDVESGRITQVLLSTGGFSASADTLRAVPSVALHHDVAQKVLHLDTTSEQLQAAPRFTNAEWNEGPQSDRRTEGYASYGELRDFGSTRAETELTSQELKHVLTLPRHMDGTINTVGPSTVESTRNRELVAKLGDHYNLRSARNPDGTWTRDYYPIGSDPTGSVARRGNVQKASKLIGLSVENRQGTKLGDVDNLLVDLAAGRIVAVIISSGTFLGISDARSAIPPTALRFTSDRNTLQLDASKETLSQAPHFQANQWPDFNQPGYVGGIYRAYQVEPYFTTSDSDNTRINVRDRDDRNSRMASPDNTARNVRDRTNDRALTPLTQDTSKGDVDTTAQIRKAILAGENMSGHARNVKITTREGQVTLRGFANDAEEKRRIGEIAERSANVRGVDNQLEVRFSTVDTD